MKIRMMTTYASAKFVRNAGWEGDVSEAEAVELIDGGFAQEIKEAKAKVFREETATLPKSEDASSNDDASDTTSGPQETAAFKNKNKKGR